METPTIIASDNRVAFTSTEMWTVTHNGGIHCPNRIPANATTFGCPLPADHDGDCIPATDELLCAGVRLHPCATLDG